MRRKRKRIKQFTLIRTIYDIGRIIIIWTVVCGWPIEPGDGIAAAAVRAHKLRPPRPFGAQMIRVLVAYTLPPYLDTYLIAARSQDKCFICVYLISGSGKTATNSTGFNSLAGCRHTIRCDMIRTARKKTVEKTNNNSHYNHFKSFKAKLEQK